MDDHPWSLTPGQNPAYRPTHRHLPSFCLSGATSDPTSFNDCAHVGRAASDTNVMDHQSPATADDGFSIRFPVGLIHDLSATRSRHDALDVVAHWLPSLLETARSSITVFTPDHRGLEVLTLAGSSAIATGTILPIEGTMVGQACTQAQLWNTPVTKGMGKLDTDKLSAAGLGSCLSAPLVSGGECFGSLNMARSNEDAFSRQDEVLAASLGEVVGSTLRTLRQIESERSAAHTDSLTGLANRRAVLSLLNEQTSTRETGVVILFIDLKGFKAINDAYGHAHGDQMLQVMADRFVTITGEAGTVGRLGGDEFLVVCEKRVDLHEARQLAKRIAHETTTPIRLNSVDVEPRLNVGLAVKVHESTTGKELLAQADRAMYEAKRIGAAVVEVDKDLRLYADLLGAIDRDLDRAMASGEITCHYQPLRNLRTRAIFGCEALIRWDHPQFGLVPPPYIVERAEATDRIHALTMWGLDKVAGDWASFRNMHPEYARHTVAFNLSPRQLGWSDYVDLHMAALERHNLSPSDIVIEVVESGLIEVETTAEKTIRDLAERGVQIALDDFGTGHNVISYFSRFPIHCIKIDKSMVQVMASNPQVRIVVKGLTQIARELGIRALGEGIETAADFDACLSAGMDEGQGYLLGRPMDIDELGRVAVLEAATPPGSTGGFRFGAPSTAPLDAGDDAHRTGHVENL